MRVVIVDDQAIFRDAARQCLKARGYDVVAEAGCAASAVEAVEHHEPDAMLLDVDLGDDDGFAVCDVVTRLRPDLAVLLTSARTTRTSRSGWSPAARGDSSERSIYPASISPGSGSLPEPRHAQHVVASPCSTGNAEVSSTHCSFSRKGALLCCERLTGSQLVAVSFVGRPLLGCRRSLGRRQRSEKVVNPRPLIPVACATMSDRIERITPAYRAVVLASRPGVVWWGRLKVTGVELLPLEGPFLLVGDHDSYWDTVATGIAAAPRRQVRALAKSSMWKNKLLGAVLTGMGQIPIERGSGDTGALDRAIEELRRGACIGIYPEGTRSLGRVLRARSGIGHLARAVPEATIIGVACSGTVAIPRFPRQRPHVRVDFFEFDRPEIGRDESPQDYATRLLAQLRKRAPIEVAGRKRAAALVGRVPTWSPELAITGKPGGKGALEEALAQSAGEQD